MTAFVLLFIAYLAFDKLNWTYEAKLLRWALTAYVVAAVIGVLLSVLK